VSVSIQNGGYSPASVSIHVGDTITWTNADDQDHTVIAQDGSFNSGNIGSGRSFSHTFTTAGTIAYYCKYHPRMKGVVVVAAK
jgi:plastocyanin